MSKTITARQLLMVSFFCCNLYGCGGDENQAMVAAAHPLAVEAGLAMIKKGGTAVDAAIASQMVLGLVEPQSSGLGGGGFLLSFESRQQKITMWDGRETAPKATKDNVFLEGPNRRMNFFKAVIGGQSVGVPGLVAMLSAVHKESGALPWKDLFTPAIKLAKNGFPISARLAWWIKRDEFLKKTAAKNLFFDKLSNPRKQGEIIKNPYFANALEIIADKGADGFYLGDIASDIVRSVGGKNGFSKKDMKDYRPKKRKNLCRFYRGYKICSQPPPSSGGIVLLQILGMLEHFDIKKLQPNSADAVHLISEASRLSYADRGHYIADPDFFTVPIKKLLNKNYLQARAKTISPIRAIKKIKAGKLIDPMPPSQDERSLPSTTHLSVVDTKGNAVSLTSSIEGPFGSHIFLSKWGFFLNNEMTDFSFVPDIDGNKIANRVEGGKRPLSSMTPTIIFAPNGKLFAVLGSPGGRRIPTFVAQTIIALIDWELPMQAAINLPRHTALGSANFLGDVIELEESDESESLALALRKKNHRIIIKPLISGLHGVRVLKKSIDGGADPRRDGVALGIR